METNKLDSFIKELNKTKLILWLIRIFFIIAIIFLIICSFITFNAMFFIGAAAVLISFVGSFFLNTVIKNGLLNKYGLKEEDLNNYNKKDDNHDVDPKS